jgi:hypothetical protein
MILALTVTSIATPQNRDQLFDSEPPLVERQGGAIRLNSYLSELDRWPPPRFVARAGASERLSGPAPALAGVAPRAAAPNIQHSLALGIEVEKSQHSSALRWIKRMVAAYEFVIGHATICQNHSSPRLDSNPSAERQARSEHHGVQQIAFKSQEFRHGTVVERARQGRDEIHVTGGSAFEKTTARDLDHYFHLRRLRQCFAAQYSMALWLVHNASLHFPPPAILPCQPRRKGPLLTGLVLTPSV